MHTAEHPNLRGAKDVHHFSTGRADVVKAGGGQLAMHMDDGEEFIAGPGDVMSLPSRDAWMIRTDAVAAVDWFGASKDAK
jgi:hypothetical protein